MNYAVDSTIHIGLSTKQFTSAIVHAQYLILTPPAERSPSQKIFTVRGHDHVRPWPSFHLRTVSHSGTSNFDLFSIRTYQRLSLTLWAYMARNPDNRGCQVYILVSRAVATTGLGALDHCNLFFFMLWGSSTVLILSAGNTSFASASHDDIQTVSCS